MGEEHTPTVLVAEDEAGIRNLVSTVLRAYGWTVCEAPDGLDAVRALKERESARAHYCCVLLDLMMPGIDGLATLNYLQTDSVPLPVVAMSAYGTALDEARRMGAVATLLKPFDVFAIPEVLAAHVRCPAASSAGGNPPARNDQ